MDVVRPPDARAFLELAGPLLGRDEPLDALLDSVRRDGAPIPGIVANVTYAEEAARRWGVLTGSRWEVALSEGVFALTTVRDVRYPTGRARVATREDRELLLDWMTAFAVEALPRPDEDLEGIERALETRFSGTDAGMWLWETDDGPVSLAGYGMPTLTGIRIGPVYTPAEHRRRGYATALVADLGRSLIVEGRRACFLYTDLSNPTSNAIYERIGYERVAEATEIRFRDP